MQTETAAQPTVPSFINTQLQMVRSRNWHESQEFTEMPGGGSQLRLRLSSLEEVQRWVLSMGEHATVVGPKALAERVRKTAEEVVKRYGAER